MKAARPRATAPLLAIAIALASCGDAQDAESPLSDIDPAVARALNDQILSDPDLASINEANAALTRSSDNSLPNSVDTPEAIREAQDRAVAILGGTRSVPRLPEPATLESEQDDSPLVALEDVAAAVPGAAPCLADTRYSAIWAARMPSALPVFPRGALLEAFGTDQSGCELRAIRFRSPVPGEDIARFYVGRAEQGGYTVIYSVNETGWQVAGRSAAAHFLVRSRPSLLGHHEIDLITRGGAAVPPASNRTARPR